MEYIYFQKGLQITMVTQIPKLLIILLLLCFQPSLLADDLETAKTLYENGTQNYDVSTLNDALNILKRIPEGKEYEYLLQQGLILKRIHFIYYVEGNKKKSRELGNLAVKKNSEALKYKPQSLKAIAYRGMIYQIFATFGWRSGAKFGRKSKKEMGIVKALNPKHFLYRFMEAFAYLESPKFVGGDTGKAVEAFISLRKDYPDNEDVQVYLARAYFKEKQYQNSFEIVKQIIEHNPQNLFAHKLEKDVQKKLK